MKTLKVRSAIGTWYRASWGWKPNVTTHALVAHTDKTITVLEEVRSGWGPSSSIVSFRERREEKGSRDHKWFASFDEAKAVVVEKFQAKRDQATKMLEEAKDLSEESK